MTDDNQNKNKNTMALPSIENKMAVNANNGVRTGASVPFDIPDELKERLNQNKNVANAVPAVPPETVAPVANNAMPPATASSATNSFSVAGIKNPSHFTTVTVTNDDGKVCTSVIDPHVAPPGAVEQKGNVVSSLVAGAAGVGHNGEDKRLVFNLGDPTQVGSIPGLLFDYNDGLRVHVPEGNYRLVIIDLDDCLTVFNGDVSGTTICTTKKYFVNYRFELYKDEEMVFSHDYDAKGKNILLQYPWGVVIGDTMAWFPYAEEFRKKHGCEVYVTISEVTGKILEKSYPHIHFVFITQEQGEKNIKPEGVPNDLYATYRLGVFFPCDDRDHQPVDFRVMGLHRNAALILGLNEWEEHPPCLQPSPEAKKRREIKEPYVCIATNGSSQAKHWNNSRGWINVVKYLKAKGYRVLCIDKEDNHQVGSYMNVIPYGCEDFTGDKPLQERIDLLYHADFFIGVSSGLSWIAWGVGKPVIMISGFTLPINEFTNPYRIINYNVCNGCWNDTRITFDHKDGEWCPRHKNTERQFECSRNITPEKVCKMIDKCMKDNNFNPEGGKKQ